MTHSKRIVSYCDPISVEPGDNVNFMVSSLDEESFDGRLVRILCGDISPEGHGFEEVEIDSALDGRYAGQHQPIAQGSWNVPATRFLETMRYVRMPVPC